LAGQTAPDMSLHAGDEARGKMVFESSKSNCLSCHRIDGKGSRFGPDLSTIGAAPRGGGGGGGGRGGGAPPAAAAPTPARGAAPAFGGDAVANAAIGAAPALPARGGAGGNARA